MYGYTITVNGNIPSKDGDIFYKNIVCSNRMIHKFEQDKLFAETDDYIIMLDGVILNRSALIEKCHLPKDESQWLNTIIELYRENGEVFFNQLRGSFSGAFYDKASDKWIVFCDQIGSKYTYYTHVGDFFCCCEEMGYMYQLLQNNGIHYHLSIDNSYLLLTYGFMLDDRTLCEEIHKINPGCYLTFQNGQLLEHRYYMLNNQPNYSMSEKDAIEMIDHYFRQAVIRQFEKDNEYGYHHLVALSGGLDCRMTTFVAHDCGYTQQLNMTFSQTEYWDQTLPMRMSNALKHEWIFKALDNGIWLYDVDDVTRTTGGNVLYYGTAHGNSLLKYLNFECLGLEHSGQIGDVIIGSFVNTHDKEDKYTIGNGAYSTKYINRLKNLLLTLDVKKELGLIYYRGFHGANNGLQNIYNYTETLSPFLDIDVLENVLTIPIELRQNHYIYIKWILEKYPHAAEYEWEKTGYKITEPTIRLFNRETTIKAIPHRILSYCLRKIGVKNDSNNKKQMNPVGFYIANNKNLKSYLDTYFQHNDSIDNVELRNTIKEIQETGSAMDKIQAISLLAAIKLFFV